MLHLATAPAETGAATDTGPGLDAATSDVGALPDGAAADRGPPPECARAADCDDRVGCTDDRCVDGRCVRVPDDARCDDRVACTDDRCGAMGCSHAPVPARCAAGQMCDSMRGCMGGRICATNGDCADTNPCTTNERCDPASRVCQYIVLDGDMDGFPPRVCGGTDCDDGNRLTNPAATEVCNGRDDDCDGDVDEQATCFAGTGVCRAGRCECVTGRQACTGADGTRCVDFASDRSNCSACGRACDPVATGCRDGQCQCPAGTSLCQGFCVDLQTNPFHCGACGHSCPPGEVCAVGACACAPGQTRCNGACVDTRSSLYHCGVCDNRCPWDQPYCAAGSCSRCRDGLIDCNGLCIDTQSSRNDCGACGRFCSGQCVGGVCTCPAPRAWCNGTCTDILTDRTNCGACNNRCGIYTEFDGGIGIVTDILFCVAGRCACSGLGQRLCPLRPGLDAGVLHPDAAGGGDAGTQYICTDILNNRESCGACGLQCASGREYCSNGVCECYRCGGVCTDLTTIQNCGRCGNVCPSGWSCQRYTDFGVIDGYRCIGGP